MVTFCKLQRVAAQEESAGAPITTRTTRWERLSDLGTGWHAFTTGNSFGPTPENMSWWESKGFDRPTKEVFVAARAGVDCVEALISL